MNIKISVKIKIMNNALFYLLYTMITSSSFKIGFEKILQIVFQNNPKGFQAFLIESAKQFSQWQQQHLLLSHIHPTKE